MNIVEGGMMDRMYATAQEQLNMQELKRQSIF